MQQEARSAAGATGTREEARGAAGATGTKERLPDWQPRLYAAIDAHRSHKFAYGSHDCAILAADAVLAMTGVDLAAEFRGTYKSLPGALKALAKAGYADQVAIAAKHFAEIHPAFAEVGDLAAIPTEEGWMALGVVTGPVIQIFAREGIGSVPLSDAGRAFRV